MYCSKDNPSVADPADLLGSYNLPPGLNTNSGLGAPRSAAVEEHWKRLEAEEDADPSSGSHFPSTLRASTTFNWDDELSELPRVAVTAAEVAAWKNDPQPLLDGGAVFVEDGQEEGYRVHSFTTFTKGGEMDRMFYVQVAEDDEAYAYTSDFFFDMLAKSERVVRG